jgi:hypothetical protein
MTIWGGDVVVASFYLIPWHHLEVLRQTTKNFSQDRKPVLKMEATCSSDASVDFLRTTRYYIPDDRTLQDSWCFCRDSNHYLRNTNCSARYSSSYTSTAENRFEICLGNKPSLPDSCLGRALTGLGVNSNSITQQRSESVSRVAFAGKYTYHTSYDKPTMSHSANGSFFAQQSLSP